MCFEVVLQRLMDGEYRGPADVYSGAARRRLLTHASLLHGSACRARAAGGADSCRNAAAPSAPPRPSSPAPPATADIQSVWAQARATSPPGGERALAAERLAPLVHQLWLYCGLDMPGSAGTPPPPPLQGQPSLPLQGQPSLGGGGDDPAQWAAQAAAYQRQPSLQPQLQPALGGGGGWPAAQQPQLHPAGWGGREASPQVPPDGSGRPYSTPSPQHALAAAAAGGGRSPLGFPGGGNGGLDGGAGFGAAPGSGPQPGLEQRQREMRRHALLRLKHEMRGEAGGAAAAGVDLSMLGGGGAAEGGPSLAAQHQAWLPQGLPEPVRPAGHPAQAQRRARIGSDGHPGTRGQPASG